jgi:O-antigen ligase
VLILGLAACSVLLGAVQLMSGGTMGVIQSEGYGSNNVHGVFANRNSSGLFFVMALVALVAWTFSRPRKTSMLAASAAAAVLLLLCLVLTRSRSSMALSLVVLPVLGYALGRTRQFTGRQVALLSALVLAAGVSGIVGLGVLGNSNVQSSVDRFSNIENIRPIIWEDTVTAIGRYGVVGSGIGTFDEVFQVDESLEHLDPRRAGRAHNDWLEAILEAGALGAILPLAWAAWILTRGMRALRSRAPVETVAALAILVMVALQSILDYPLRNETILCIAALAVALLQPAVSRARGVESGMT